MSFLPEFDRDFLEGKGISFEEVVEPGRGRGVIFNDFPIPEGLFARNEGRLVETTKAAVLVMIPDQYNDSALDSFYVYPPIYLSNGVEALNTSGRFEFNGRSWQFWSRHQQGAWRAGIDGLDTFVQIIKEALRDK